jgi:hypothetical protein
MRSRDFGLPRSNRYSGVAVRHHDQDLFTGQRARNGGPTEMLCDEFSDGQPGLDVGQRLTV